MNPTQLHILEAIKKLLAPLHGTELPLQNLQKHVSQARSATISKKKKNTRDGCITHNSRCTEAGHIKTTNCSRPDAYKGTYTTLKCVQGRHTTQVYSQVPTNKYKLQPYLSSLSQNLNGSLQSKTTFGHAFLSPDCSLQQKPPQRQPVVLMQAYLRPSSAALHPVA